MSEIKPEPTSAPWIYHEGDILDSNGCWVVVEINARQADIDHIIHCVNTQEAKDAQIESLQKQLAEAEKVIETMTKIAEAALTQPKE